MIRSFRQPFEQVKKILKHQKDLNLRILYLNNNSQRKNLSLNQNHKHSIFPQISKNLLPIQVIPQQVNNKKLEVQNQLDLLLRKRLQVNLTSILVIKFMKKKNRNQLQIPLSQYKTQMISQEPHHLPLQQPQAINKRMHQIFSMIWVDLISIIIVQLLKNRHQVLTCSVLMQVPKHQEDFYSQLLTISFQVILLVIQLKYSNNLLNNNNLFCNNKNNSNLKNPSKILHNIYKYLLYRFMPNLGGFYNTN